VKEAKRILDIVLTVAYCIVMAYCLLWAVRGLREEFVRFRERLARNRELRRMRDAADRIRQSGKTKP
jgi:predicted PurR-regulated permease PerM